MEDNVNDGGTRYLDKDGKELTKQEYAKLLKREQTADIRGHVPEAPSGDRYVSPEQDNQGGKDR